jgi:hypothetical protein
MVPPQPVPSDADLIRRCLEGASAAWQQLYRRYQAPVQAAARTALGCWGCNNALVEELTNKVLGSLWVQGCRRLRAYDASRAGLATYLDALTAQIVAERVLQFVGRQTKATPLGNRDPIDRHPTLWAKGVLLDEIATRLTPCERVYFEACLLGRAEAAAAVFAPTHAWKLRQGIAAKIRGVLDYPPG